MTKFGINEHAIGLAVWILLTAAMAQGAPNFQALRLAIADLSVTHGEHYQQGQEFLNELTALEASYRAGNKAAVRQFEALKQKALLANPLLQDLEILVVKRRSRLYRPTEKDKRIWHSGSAGLDLGFPSNHECNSSLPRQGYDNELAVLSALHPGGELTRLYRPPDGGYVGEMDLHWDADRLLFTRADAVNWKLWEIHTDGSGLRQVSQLPDDVDAFDGCYLPGGRIVFGSTASFQAVPCWHGQKWVSNLYSMGADGTGVRQLCFDQDHDFHPVVMPNGQVLYHRWDYTGINHIFLRQLMAMNPDGTGQRAVYGSSSWFPNALYFPRPLPGDSSRMICILSGYHGVHRMGQLVLIDRDQGWHEAAGLVQRISGKGDPIKPLVRDNLVDRDWPKFLQPFPLSQKHFLVACLRHAQSKWGIYLADVFDNLVLIREEPGFALLEPIPMRQMPRPPVLPDRVEPDAKEALVYLHNIQAGPGLEGVPPGTVRSLRVMAYHFGYRSLAGPDKIGYGGPWEVMRILGTVPLDEDGSASFRVPPNTPLAIQPLDAEGKAVQLMRSWFTAMPGETVSCVGCHETPQEVPPIQRALAATRAPQTITPWHGSPRGFDFAREVQPVLDRYCVGCHDGNAQARLDLRAEELVTQYAGTPISKMGISRLHETMQRETKGVLRYTPAYEALLPYVRRVGIEDDVSLLRPGEYHADTSPLVQLLRQGHQGVELDAEAWDRLVTWIDLNAPCHGTWGEVFPVPDNGHERRMTLRRRFGGAELDPEAIPPLPKKRANFVQPKPLIQPQPVHLDDWPFSPESAQQRQATAGQRHMTIDLGDRTSLKLVRIPAGDFVMGDPAGAPDEWPPCRVTIREPYWMAVHEISNAQYQKFDADHDARYYTKRHARGDDQGLPLNQPDQPVVRVSWEEAVKFCQWLTRLTGRQFRLPTEAQWEYACRAGTAAPLYYGEVDADFSKWGNMADASFSRGLMADQKQVTGGLEHLMMDGAALSETRFKDGAVVTVGAGSFKANAWGLSDLHGNAAEWTRTVYAPYPYRDDDGRNEVQAGARKVVRGGSFFDPPRRCRSAYRLSYPSWQQVFNVGFRVVCED